MGYGVVIGLNNKKYINKLNKIKEFRLTRKNE
jgi:hypothetical protein